MKEHYCTYEQAVALKRLGFAEKVKAVWHFDGEKWNLIPDYGTNFVHPKDIPHWNTSRVWGAHIYSAPRLDQAAAWMRECKGIDVLVFNSACGYGWEISKADPQSRGTMIALFDNEGEDEPSGMWWTYEKALSAGIDKALELLGKEAKE